MTNDNNNELSAEDKWRIQEASCEYSNFYPSITAFEMGAKYATKYERAKFAELESEVTRLKKENDMLNLQFP